MSGPMIGLPDDDRESKDFEVDRDISIGEVIASVLRPGTGEVRTKSSTGGEKGVKLARYDLIPVGPLKMLAEHYGRGAQKYADHQWRQGYEFSKSISALMRHFEAWRGGEDYDVCGPDCDRQEPRGESEHGPTCFNHTGSHHLCGVLWHGMFLLEGTEHWPEHDDRFIYTRKVQT